MIVKDLKWLLENAPDEAIVEGKWAGMWEELAIERVRIIEVKPLKVKEE